MKFDFKYSSKKELKNKYNEMASEAGDEHIFTRKELRYLPEVLADNEQVLAFTSGYMGNSTWLIVLTDQRIMFLDKGWLFGLKQIEMSLDKINSVSSSTGMLFGRISVRDGSQETLIENVLKGTVTHFTTKANMAMAEFKRNQIREVYGQGELRPQQQAQQDAIEDPYAKLEKLASLKEKGILTQEEFDQEKIKILGNNNHAQ